MIWIQVYLPRAPFADAEENPSICKMFNCESIKASVDCASLNCLVCMPVFLSLTLKRAMFLYLSVKKAPVIGEYGKVQNMKRPWPIVIEPKTT